MVFGVPVLFFFGGLAIGNIFSETIGVLLAFVLLAASFTLIRRFDSYAAQNPRFRSRIIRKIP